MSHRRRRSFATPRLAITSTRGGAFGDLHAPAGHYRFASLRTGTVADFSLFLIGSFPCSIKSISLLMRVGEFQKTPATRGFSIPGCFGVR